MTATIPYALKDGDLVHVDTVPRGASCGCVCPGCGEGLIAKKGEVMAHHFAHKANAVCASHGETVVHWIAKHWFAERAKIQNIKPFTYNGPQRIAIGYNGLWVEIEEISLHGVEVENRRGVFTPDVRGTDQSGGEVWLEVAVTHKCEDRKIAHCQQNDITLIQIEVDPRQFDYNSYESYLAGLEARCLSISYRILGLEVDACVSDFWIKRLAKLDTILENRDKSVLQQICANEISRFERDSEAGNYKVLRRDVDLCPRVELAALSKNSNIIPGITEKDYELWRGTIFGAHMPGKEYTYLGGKKINLNRGNHTVNGSVVDLTPKQSSAFMAALKYHRSGQISDYVRERSMIRKGAAWEGCKACRFNKGCIERTAPGGLGTQHKHGIDVGLVKCSFPSADTPPRLVNNQTSAQP